MKYLPLFSTCLIIFSCSHRKEYKAEDFLQAQIEYEALKKETKAKRGRFFEDQRVEFIWIVGTIDRLSDTTREDKDINTDSTFFMDEVEMDPINFGLRVRDYRRSSEDTLPKVGAIFVNRGESGLPDNLFTDPLEELRECFATNVDIPCLRIKEDRLQSIIGLKYAFVVHELLVVNPVLKGKEFDGGIYVANIICYDLLTNAPLLSFMTSASSSDEVKASRMGMSNEDMIADDFKKNVRKAILSSCREHFVISENLNFAHSVF